MRFYSICDIRLLPGPDRAKLSSCCNAIFVASICKCRVPLHCHKSICVGILHCHRCHHSKRAKTLCNVSCHEASDLLVLTLDNDSRSATTTVADTSAAVLAGLERVGQRNNNPST